MKKIKVSSGKNTVQSASIAIFQNFLNQGFRYMIVEEKIVKVFFEICTFLILMKFGFLFWVSLYFAHTLNWILNGQLWVLSRYVYPMNLFEFYKISQFISVIEKLLSKVDVLDCIISGSLTEGKHHRNSDLDIRIIAGNVRSAYVASLIAVYLRILAFFNLVPLDIFVLASYDGLNRLKNERRFYSILNQERILKDGRMIQPYSEKYLTK